MITRINLKVPQHVPGHSTKSFLTSDEFTFEENPRGVTVMDHSGKVFRVPWGNVGLTEEIPEKKGK